MTASKAGPNSAAPTTAEVIGGVYNATPPVLVDGQATALQVDVNGKLITSGGGGGTSNVNITGVNGSAPALANPLPVELSDGSQAVGTASNPLSEDTVGVQSVVSAGNSSTATLGGGATFTGASVDLTAVPGYISVQTQSFSDVAGTLQIQFSSDNVNWDHVVTAVAPAGNPTSVANGIHARFMRVVYVNGGSPQTAFRLQTLLVPGVVQATIKDLETSFDINDNALATHSVITGKTTAGGNAYVDVKVNPSGTLATQDGADGTTGAAAGSIAAQQGLIAATSLPTAVTNAQLIGAMSDKFGRATTVLNAVRDLIGTAVLSNNSGTSAQSLIGAGATGVFNDIITFIVTNRSSTATVVTLTDGTASYTFAIAGNGGMVINFPTPLPETSSATAWTVGNSAAVACDYVAVYAKNK